MLGLLNIGHSTLHRNTDPKFINITINAPRTPSYTQKTQFAHVQAQSFQYLNTLNKPRKTTRNPRFK